MSLKVHILSLWAIVVSAVSASPFPTPQNPVDSSTCSASSDPISPISGDCNWDWVEDASIPTKDLTIPQNLDQMYASRYKAILEDDTPVLVLTSETGRKIPPKSGGRSITGRENSRSSLYNSMISKFEKVGASKTQ